MAHVATDVSIFYCFLVVDMYQEEEQRITTTLSELDQILGGWISNHGITEIFGESGFW